jgi:type IV pilus assembly protein PilB
VGSFDIDKLLSELESESADPSPTTPQPPKPLSPLAADDVAQRPLSPEAEPPIHLPLTPPRVNEHLAALTTAQRVQPAQFTPISDNPFPALPPKKTKSRDASRDRSRDLSRDQSRDQSRDFSRDASVDEDDRPAWNDRCFVDLRSAETDELQLRIGSDRTAMVQLSQGNPERTSREQALIDHLIRENIVDAAKVNAAKKIAKTSPGVRFAELLIEQGVDEIKLSEALAAVYRLPFRRITDDSDPERDFSAHLVDRVGLRICQELCILPLGADGSRLILGTASPVDAFSIDEVRMRLRARSISLVVVPPTDIRMALDRLDTGEDEGEEVEAILSDIDEDDVQVVKDAQEEVDLEREAAESPVIRYVNYIIQQAVKEGASDIHIEPGDKSLKVRFRIDGILHESMQPPAKMAAAIVSRLKIMGNLDISERRVPQDGRIRCSVQGRKLDLRMSTLPTAAGHEKVVMRILDTKSIQVTLDDLGFDEDSLTIWRKQIDQPHGIVLVTGPTGSGKTTTLYASLGQMDKKTKNISTVEDPVEYHLEGITQTQMHEKIGMTFAAALKSLLRQDPDVILLGEIRDIETATIAIQASLTGHLVLSTLHTNDAPSAVTRLGNIGVENFLIGAALNAVLAQRLVRKICDHCKAPAEHTEEMCEFLEMQGIDPTATFEGKGCDRCRGLGYSGRRGIYELLVVDDHLRDIIARGPNVTEFRRTCTERGMVTLRHDGFRKVLAGVTTPQEILRVTDATI